MRARLIVADGAQRWVKQLVGTCSLGLLTLGGHAQATPAPVVEAPHALYFVGPGVTLPLRSPLTLQAYGYGLLGDLQGTATLVSVRGQLNRYVAITPAYLGIFPTRRADGTPQWDNRARLDVTLTLPLGCLSISSRQLVERRFQSAVVATRYRPQLRVEDTLRLGRVRFTAYMADELFYDAGVQHWTINLTYLGLACRLGHRCRGEVFYARQLGPQAADFGLLLAACSIRLQPLRRGQRFNAWGYPPRHQGVPIRVSTH